MCRPCDLVGAVSYFPKLLREIRELPDCRASKCARLVHSAWRLSRLSVSSVVYIIPLLRTELLMRDLSFLFRSVSLSHVSAKLELV